MSDKTLQDIQRALTAPFPLRQLSWRVGDKNEACTRGRVVPYLNARDVEDRLDEALGFGNWKNEQKAVGGGIVCALSLRLNGEWVSREDGAPATRSSSGRGNVEDMAVKGAFSDALKRAAVLWGIGRYLYAFRAPWVDLDPRGVPLAFNALDYFSEDLLTPEDQAELAKYRQDVSEATPAPAPTRAAPVAAPEASQATASAKRTPPPTPSPVAEKPKPEHPAPEPQARQAAKPSPEPAATRAATPALNPATPAATPAEGPATPSTIGSALSGEAALGPKATKLLAHIKPGAKKESLLGHVNNPIHGLSAAEKAFLVARIQALG